MRSLGYAPFAVRAAAAVAAAMLVLSGCARGGAAGDDPTGGDSAPAAEAPSDTPTQSDGASETGEPSDPASAGASDLFVALPEGYEYAPPEASVERQVRDNLERSEGAEFVADVQMTTITKGSFPVAYAVVIGFTAEADTGFKAGFVRGAAAGAGAEPQVIELGGEDVTYLDADGVHTILFLVGDVAIMVFSDVRAEAEAVAAALVEGNA